MNARRRFFFSWISGFCCFQKKRTKKRNATRGKLMLFGDNSQTGVEIARNAKVCLGVGVCGHRGRRELRVYF